jgi:hypothetical protein
MLHQDASSSKRTIDFKRNQIATLIRFSLYFVIFTFILFSVLQLLIHTGFEIMLKDNNIIEWTELLLLIATTVFLFLASRRTQEFPVLYTILALLPVIAAFRELDSVLDRIFHGAWIIPAAIIYMIIFYKIIKWFNQLKGEVLCFVQTQQMVFLGIGFLIVVIFAQLSGQQIVWRAVLGQNYLRVIGRLVEELTEFLGYFILLVGSVECWVSARTNHFDGAYGSKKHKTIRFSSTASRIKD